MLAVVDKTPGTVTVTRNAASIDVQCSLADHQPATELITPQFNNATIGNLLIGGVIGVMVDASSGSNFDYATHVYLKLPPTRFSNASQREAYFEAWRAELLQDANRARTTLAQPCKGEKCDEYAQRTDEQVRTVMTRIDAASAAASVTSPPAGNGQAS